MVINEKILVRELKAAYKSGGYIVINRPGGRTVFWTPAWTVEINTENLPREARHHNLSKVFGTALKTQYEVG